jgi:hypothetical protein
MREYEDQKYYTELDDELRNLALCDWPTFYELIGRDAITSAKICILRKRNLSYGQIKIKLDITTRQAEYGSCKCNL